ncbi:MAG: CapA family protein [Ruminococcaceae bacterium]|nr:CapA family protein [Oscillospiraceae bacterium]
MENEPKRRRRRPRRAKKRRLFLPVLIAVVCVAAVVFFATNGKPEDPTEPGDVDKTVINLSFGGDLNITDDVVAAAGSDGSFQGAFMDVLPLLSDADLAALNLEGTFSGGPYGSESKSAPAALATALKKAGVDILQLANSCTLRGGIGGLVSTIDTVKYAGLEPLGVYRNTEEARKERGFVLMEVKGVKIAFVAFTKGMDGMTLPAGSEGCINLLYKDYDSTYQKVDEEGISKIMDDVSRAKPDLVVAMLHWGSEFNDTISDSQEKICKLLQEKGADVLIGTHPHYVQKMVFDKEKGTFVAYSLGDFFGDATRAGSEYSVILHLEVTKNDKTGETRVSGFDYTPIFTVRQEGRPLRVIRIRETMAAYENQYMDAVPESVYKDMAYALKRIEARIKG